MFRWGQAHASQTLLAGGARRFSPSMCSTVHPRFEGGTVLLPLPHPCVTAAGHPLPSRKGFSHCPPRHEGSQATRELPATLSPPRASQQKTGSRRREESGSTPGCTGLPCSLPLQTASGTEAFVFSTPFPFLLSSPFLSCYLALFSRGWY